MLVTCMVLITLTYKNVTTEVLEPVTGPVLEQSVLRYVFNGYWDTRRFTFRAPNQNYSRITARKETCTILSR